MRPKYLNTILVLLALALPASPAHAAGIVSICDEAHLRAALIGGGSVTFSCSGTITLTAEITIAANATVDGSGQNVTISGNNAVRVFTVNPGVTLNLNRLTVANGWYAHGDGGGIYNAGTLTIANSTLSNNSATGDLYSYGGGIVNGNGTVTVSNSTFSGNWAHSGGAILNCGTLAVSSSTFSGNSAKGFGGGGGGIYNACGTVTVSNSTFSGNSANEQGSGGAICNRDTLIVSNSTFSGNSANYGVGGAIITGVYGGPGLLNVINSTFSGNRAHSAGGIYLYGGTATFKNTIVANNRPGGNCGGAIVVDGGGNLSYPGTACPGINADPLLGPLQNNGGPTETMAPGPGSAALDAANDVICAAPPVNNLDQRGITRPWGAHCDIGAVEQQPYKKRGFLWDFLGDSSPMKRQVS